MINGLADDVERLFGFFLKLPFAELVRYAIVGFTLNLIGYLVYLLVTALWLSPVATVTIFYPISVLAGYIAHRRHTFQQRERGLEGAKFVKYIIVYILGYLINILLLVFFHGELGFPHQWVQLSAIFIVAIFLFVSMKFFVFNSLKL